MRNVRFKIYLPAIRDENAKAAISQTAEMPAFGTETVLMVDDEELIRDLGTRILRSAGYTVLTASTGQEALELYEKERAKIALVLLDLIMPGMGGKQCLEELVKIDPSVRVVLASGLSIKSHTTGALAAGAKAFVNKPFQMKEMLRTVRRVLDENG